MKKSTSECEEIIGRVSMEASNEVYTAIAEMTDVDEAYRKVLNIIISEIIKE